MAELSTGGFIVLPGGFGTFEEVSLRDDMTSMSTAMDTDSETILRFWRW